eukprot:353251-Chlamydomonas_euryale.AAC.3
MAAGGCQPLVLALLLLSLLMQSLVVPHLLRFCSPHAPALPDVPAYAGKNAPLLEQKRPTTRHHNIAKAHIDSLDEGLAGAKKFLRALAG